jgi:hypothetical protein
VRSDFVGELRRAEALSCPLSPRRQSDRHEPLSS